MKLLQELLDLTEGEVIRAEFGPPKIPAKYDIYDEFEFDTIGDGKAKLIGIADGGKRTTELDVGPDKEIRAKVAAYNRQRKAEWEASKGKPRKTDSSLKTLDRLPPGAKPVSMLQAFGNSAEAALDDVGIRLTEKPSYWEDFDGDGYAAKNNVHEVKLKKIEKTIGKLKVWTGKEVFGYDGMPKGPQVKTKLDPKELGDMAIIRFSTGDRYLVSPQGASTYIRNWQKIV